MKQTTTPPSPFGTVDNKSAESLVSEAKDAQSAPKNEKEPAVADAPETTEVELIHHWNDEDGKARVPGETVTVPVRLAVSLIGSYVAKPIA